MKRRRSDLVLTAELLLLDPWVSGSLSVWCRVGGFGLLTLDNVTHPSNFFLLCLFSSAPLSYR